MAAFSATGGPVRVAPEQLVRRRADIAAVLAGMVTDLDLPVRWQPAEQVDGLVWELGEMRLGKGPQRNSLWFARRLSDREVQKQVKAAVLARPHPRLRVLLTSSRSERLVDLELPGTSVVPVRDVLAAPDVLAISGDILAARISSITPAQGGEPVQLSEDGTTLVILGGEPIHFRSAEQITVIRKLVAARKSGKRFRAQDLATHGTLRRLFGEAKWEKLQPFLKSVHGRWGFDV